MGYLEQSRDRLPEWIDLLREIVDVDSGPGDIEGIDAVYETLVERLVPLGFEFDRHETAGPEVLRGRRAAAGGARMRLVLVGHADTVFPSGTSDHRPMEVRGDRITGPGVADMKGGLVVAVSGLSLAGPAVLDRLDVDILVNGDEESGSLHSRRTIEELTPGADAVLVF